MEFHNLAPNNISDVLEIAKPALPEYSTKNPPKLVFYLSKKRSEAEQKAMVEQAKSQFEKQYPGVPVSVQTRYLQHETTLEEAAKQNAEAIEEAAKNAPQDAETEAVKEVLLKANQEALKEAKAFENALPSYMDPANSQRMIEYSARTNGTLSGVQRTLQLFLSGVQGTPTAIASAITLVAGDAAYNYLITKYENLVGKIQSEHGIPLAKRFGLDRLNAIYTQNKHVQLVKSIASNIPIFSIGIAGAQQTAAHFANPDVNGAYSQADISRNVSLGLLWSGIYFGGFIGAEKLKQKGRMSQPAVDLYRKALGVIYTINGAVATSGRPEILDFLMYTTGPLWTFTLLPGVVNMFRSTKNDRIVLVDNLIDNRDHLNQLENLEETFVHAKDKAEMDSKLPEILKQKKIKKNIWEKSAGAIARGTKTVYQSLGKACGTIARQIASNP